MDENNKLPNGLQREASPPPKRVPKQPQQVPKATGQATPQRVNPKLQKGADVDIRLDEPTPVQAPPPPKKPMPVWGIVLIVIASLLVVGGIITGIVFYIGERLVVKDAMVVGLNNQIDSLNDTIAELREAVADTTVQEVTKETSLRTVEGSLVPQFVSIDDKVIFPNAITLPSANDDINNSYIMLGSKFKFIPSNNWIIKMQGSTMYMSHPSKIQGVLRSVSISEVIRDEAYLKQLVQDFFVGFPSTTITYRKIFLGDRVAGMQGKAKIVVDDVDHQVIVGFFQRNEYAVTYIYLYEEDNSAVQDELIDLFINSGSYGDNKVILE